MHLEKLFSITRCKIIWLTRKKFICQIPLPYRRMNHINQPPLETHTHKRAHRGRAYHVGLGHDGVHQGCDGDRPRGHCRGDCKPPHYPTRWPLSAELGSSEPRVPQIQSCARTEKRVCSVSSRLSRLLAAKNALGMNRGAVSHALRLCDDAGGAPSTVQQRRRGRLAGARKRSLVSCSILGLD
jgi:hypothetical protein